MKVIPYIPYFQTSRYRVQTMIDLADIQPGEKTADLGTGDGRIAIAFSKAGAAVTAYELDDERIKEAKENIKKELGQFSFSLEQYSLSELKANREVLYSKPPLILKKDFWFEDLSQYSIICCYPMPTIMGRLEKKLMTELKPGSRVLLNYFPFTHWKEKAKKDNVFLYKK